LFHLACGKAKKRLIAFAADKAKIFIVSGLLKDEIGKFLFRER